MSAGNHHALSHHGHSFIVEFGIHDSRRGIDADITRCRSPRATYNWIWRTFLSYDQIPAALWTSMTATYRGYGQEDFTTEHLSIEAWNSGFRWPGLHRWLTMNEWSREIAGTN